MLFCVRLYLFDFGCRDILWIDAANAYSLAVHLQHDLRRFFPAQREELLQYGNDEIHRSIVVVQQ
ncbi:hypothetical protein D3C83_127540 [compost metagenome]